MIQTTAAGAKPRLGIVQVYALVFGVAYIAVALLEDILGGSGLSISGTTVLHVTLTQNLIHWAIGVAVLGSFFAGEATAKVVARVVGVVFVVVTLLGFLVEPFTGKLLGFSGDLPMSYNVVHLLTAAAALFAGFAATRAYGRN